MPLARLPALQVFHMLHELNGMSPELPGLQRRANFKGAPFASLVLEVCASLSFPKRHFNDVTAFEQRMSPTSFFTSTAKSACIF